MHTIAITDDTYQRLAQKASQLQITIENLIEPALQRLAEDEAENPSPVISWQEELEAMRREALSRADRYPPGFQLDDSRETMYEERLRSQL